MPGDDALETPRADPSRRPWQRTRLVRSSAVAGLLLGAAWLLDDRELADKSWFLVQLLPVSAVSKFLHTPVLAGSVTIPLAILVNGLILRGIWDLLAPYGGRGTPPPKELDLERPQRHELGCLLTLAILSAAMSIPGFVGAREKARTAACDALWFRVVRADPERLRLGFDDETNPRNRAQPGVTTSEAEPCQVHIAPTGDDRLLATQTVHAYGPRQRSFVIELSSRP